MTEINSEFIMPKEQQICVVNSSPKFSQCIDKNRKHDDIISASIINPIGYLGHGIAEQ